MVINSWVPEGLRMPQRPYYFHLWQMICLVSFFDQFRHNLWESETSAHFFSKEFWKESRFPNLQFIRCCSTHDGIYMCLMFRVNLDSPHQNNEIMEYFEKVNHSDHQVLWSTCLLYNIFPHLWFLRVKRSGGCILMLIIPCLVYCPSSFSSEEGSRGWTRQCLCSGHDLIWEWRNL